MAAEFRCDICGKKCDRKPGTRIGDIKELCTDCLKGIRITIELMKIGPFLNHLEEAYNHIVGRPFNE